MKTKLLLILCLLLCKLVPAQINLVPNFNFEDTVACPTNYAGQYGDQIYNLTNWFPASNSPDYFNTCSNSEISIPLNGFGFQQPYDGNGYIGLFTFYNYSTNYREYIGVQLSQNLVIGTKYFFKMYLSASFGGVQFINTFSNNLGVKFSTIQYESFANPLNIDNSATSKLDTIISDTLNWTSFQFSFIADSTYHYLYLGNFFENIQTDTVNIAGANFNQGAYYYIDNICLSTDSNFCETILSAKENKDDIFSVFPNPCIDKIQINTSFEITELRLYNLLGILIKSVKANSKSIEYNVSDLIPGNYLMQIFNRNKQYKSTIFQKL